MKKINQKKEKRLDLLGLTCGLIVLVIAVITLVVNLVPSTAGVKDSQIPAEAVSLVGSAPGRNGDIKVTVVATPDKIYQIKVDEHQETQNIGTVAIKKLPVEIFKTQNMQVDIVSGATITSDALKAAIVNALESGDIQPAKFGGSRVKMEKLAETVETASGVSMMRAADWADEYPEVYASYKQNAENDSVHDYLVDYPMLKTLYEPFGFSKDYKSARGHYYNLEDIGATARIGEKSIASCWTCKAPEFTHMVNEQGVEVYAQPFKNLVGVINEPISCYNCHANNPGTVTITHGYLVDGVGEDFAAIDAGNLACGQCHVEYYFDPANSATVLPHNDLDSMSPDAILAFFNDASNFANGVTFADYTNPRTGVRQIKVQHPELETYLGEGSQHRLKYSCIDCHMGETTAENGEVITSHYLTSPLNNPTLIANECSACHEDLVADVKAIQEEAERRTYAVGYELEYLTECLAAAVASEDYTEAELDAIRALARDAQFYWDYVFVENSEGAHNSALTHECLDKAEALCNEALGLFKRA